MKQNEYQEIVAKALDIAKAGFADGTSVEKIAAKTGYSPSRLREIFQKVTGRALVEHILDFKLTEAKRLLAQTDLNITEIALEVGFGSHEHFSRTFRGKTGLSPSQFRSANRGDVSASTGSTLPQQAARMRDWFAQEFSGEALSLDLEISDGSLEEKVGCTEGRGPESFGFLLRRALPENVEISVDLKMLSEQNGGPSHVLLSFFDPSFSAAWYQITLGAYDLYTCTLRQVDVNRRIQTNAPIKPDQWQTLRVRIIDDRISVLLDESILFDFQNDFPPSYNQRCRFRFGSYRSAVHFRRLCIKDLGIPLMTPTIRQGDALYNAASYDAAREFYGRLLEMQTGSAGSGELAYKIGKCFSSQEAFSQSRTWLEKAVANGDQDFWATQAKLGIMTLDMIGQESIGTESARAFLGHPDLRDEARIALENMCKHYWERGDFDRIVSLYDLILEKSEAEGLQSCLMHRALAEAHEWLMQMNQSEKHLSSIANSALASKEIKIQALRELAYVWRVQGKLDQAEAGCAQLAKSTDNPSNRADCDVLRAFLLRAREKTADALSLLDEIASRSNIPDRSAWAKLEASLILCGLGSAEEARQAITEAVKLCPHLGYLQIGSVSRYRYVPELVSGNFVAASEFLLADSRVQDSMVFPHARQAMMAGLIMEIAGDKKRSRRIWAEMLRRFPLQRCAHIALAVERLSKGEMPEWDRLPIGNEGLSEMLYLAARVCESRGDRAQSQTLFKRCVELDGSLRWPAYLAKMEETRRS